MEPRGKESGISNETVVNAKESPSSDDEPKFHGNRETPYDGDNNVLSKKGNIDASQNCPLNRNSGCKTVLANMNNAFSKQTLLPFNSTYTGGNDIFGPILAVHSNEYIERRREGIRQIAKCLNPRFSIIKPVGNPSLSRPKWPFLPWNESRLQPKLNPDVFLSEFDETFDRHERHSSQETYVPELSAENQNVNFDFIHFVLKGAEDAFHMELSPEYKKVREDVRIILENVCKEMANQHLVFQNYSIIEMGSTMEGTKFGDPDEFDFMIDLPNLNQSLEFYTAGMYSFKHENRDVRVKKRDVFQDFKNLSEELAEEGDYRTFMRRVWNEIQIELANIMKKNVLPGWKWLDTVPAYTSTLAQTNKLLWKGKIYKHLIVDIDICICLKPPEFETNIDFNQDILDKSRPGVSAKGRRKSNRIEEKIYLLLRSDGEARWTRAILEKEILASFPEEDGRKSLLRSLKYFNQKFLPKHYNDVLFRLDPGIPSYWLKTIVFYLMTWYYEDLCWTKDCVSLRFFEAWIILKECLHKKNLSSFFVPHNILAKLCPLGSENEDYKKLLKDFTIATEYLNMNQKIDENGMRTIENEIERRNSVERDKGIFNSVIELCYFYAFNDFADENKEALQSFIEEVGNEQFILNGDGSELKLIYRGSTVDINGQISEKYGETKLYFA